MSAYAQKELAPPTAPIKRGDTGQKVRQAQEWLCLHGFHTAVDGDFGPATEAALKEFQRTSEEPLGPDELGVAGQDTWAALTEPLRRVMEWERDPPLSHGGEIVACARAHLAAQPREVGGPNAGPWVRYYCRGQEVPWCAGFATTVLGQALGHDGWYTLSCDELAEKAKRRGDFLRGRLIGIHPAPKPGDVFLIRNTAPDQRDDWNHTGIVTAVGDGYFETAEGNTNTTGAREGTAVHSRTRAFSPNVDFVLTGGDGT